MTPFGALSVNRIRSTVSSSALALFQIVANATMASFTRTTAQSNSST